MTYGICVRILQEKCTIEDRGRQALTIIVRRDAWGRTKLEEPFCIAHVLLQRREYRYIFVYVQSIKSVYPMMVPQGCEVGSKKCFEGF